MISKVDAGGTAEPVSRDQILRRERGQGKNNFACSTDHEQDWQPYLLDPYYCICDDQTYIHTLTLIAMQVHQNRGKITRYTT